jgi:hypothetical protein
MRNTCEDVGFVAIDCIVLHTQIAAPICLDLLLIEDPAVLVS